MSNTTRSKYGSKQQIAPNKWRLFVSAGRKSDGKRRRMSKVFEGTESEADAELMRFAYECGNTAMICESMTLHDYFWLCFSPERHKTTTRANAMNYDSIYKCHIDLPLGRLRLCELDYPTIKRWVLSLPPQSAQAYVTALRAILNQAFYDGAMKTAVMRDYQYKLPRGKGKAPLPVWGAREVKRCLDALDGDPLYCLWLVMVGGGLSRSEALALDWESILWEPRGSHWVAHVNVAGAYTAKDGEKPPKNDRRYRRVPIMPLFADRLYKHRATGAICKGARGGRMSPNQIPNKWKALFATDGKLAGLPFVQIGRMRATYSTLMQRAGIDSTIINAMQGRAENSRVLYTNYLNPAEDTFSESADTMQRLVSENV